jgi:cation transport ATPase
LAKKFHPDVAAHPEEAEIFKVISAAYTILSDEQRKFQYDQQLRNAFYFEQVSVKSNPQEDMRKRQAARQAQQKLSEEEAIRRKNKKFALSKRLLLSIVLSIWGLQIIYSNWFINLNNYTHIRLILGCFVFIGSCLFFLSTAHQYFHLKKIQKKLKGSYEKISWNLFLGLLLLGPLGVFGLNKARQNYHLKHYAITEKAVIESTHRTLLTFRFEDQQGNYISKTVEYDPDFIVGDRYSWIIIEYSSADSRIARPIKRKR